MEKLKKFYTLTPTSEDKRKALELVNAQSKTFYNDWKQPPLNKYIGELSEVIVRRLYGLPDKKPNKTSDPGFDVILNNLKVDVKAQASTKHPIHQDYGWNVEKRSWDKHACDYYLFTHFNKRTEEVTIVGRCSHKVVGESHIDYKGDINPTTKEPFYATKYSVAHEDLEW